MIGSVRGEVIDRRPAGEVLIEVAGIGYRIVVGPLTAQSLDPGTDAFLHVHHHQREDAQTLFGFTTIDERIVFEALIAAHGVGPSLAMAILGVHPPAELMRVLAEDDLDALCLVPGVGKKTAARLLVELKSRLEIPGLELAAVAGSSGSGPGSVGTPMADVRDALVGLGYSPDEVNAALRALPEDADTSELLRLALRNLAA